MNQSDNRAPMSDGVAFLRERDLAKRWQVSRRTLQRWRAEGSGPRFIHIGGGVRYRFSDVADYEQRMLGCGRAERDGS